jgi:hypothetical protein
MPGEENVKMEAGAADGENRPTWPAQLEFKLGSRKKAHFVAGPVRIKVGSNDDDEGELEYTVHTCPARLVPEMVLRYFISIFYTFAILLILIDCQ